MHQIKIAFSFCTQVLQVKHFNFLLLLYARDGISLQLIAAGFRISSLISTLCRTCEFVFGHRCRWSIFRQGLPLNSER